MNPIGIGLAVLVCVFGGAMLGMFLRTVLPEHHLSSDSKDVIKLGMGLTATMSALVLALLTNSAKGSFDTQRSELTQMSANIILLDRVLAHYGPETKEARDELKRTVAMMISRIWPDEGTGAQLEPVAAEAFYDKIEALSPQNEVQRALQGQAVNMSVAIGQARWLLFEQAGRSIPMPFLVMLIFWVTAIFLSFGLFAPRNATVLVTLFLCAFSVSGAIFLILELDRPFGGMIRISSAPLRSTLSQIDQPN